MNIRSTINEDEQGASVDSVISDLSESLAQPKWKQRREAIKISRQAMKVQVVSTAIDVETESLIEKNKLSTKNLKRQIADAALIGQSIAEPHDLDEAPDVSDENNVGTNSLLVNVYNGIKASIEKEQSIATELRPELQSVIDDLTVELQAKKRLKAQADRAQEIIEQLPNELKRKVMSKMSTINPSAFVDKNVEELFVSYQAACNHNQALAEEEKQVQVMLDQAAKELTQEIKVLDEGLRLVREFDAIEMQRGRYANKKK